MSEDVAAAMTVKMAAARLGVGIGTVYDLIESGVLPCRRLGVRRGKILIDRVDVESYWDASKGTSSLRAPTAARRHLRSG